MVSPLVIKEEEAVSIIPKIIHYCWFGGNSLPELAKKCMASWEKYCPDYEIVRWDESNFDVTCCDYVREAYEAKKWAFVSDVARLYALVNFGGIYMDTDVEVIRPLDSLLSYEAVSGFESETQIPTGLMACREGQALFQEFLRDYDGKHFLNADGSYDLTTNVARITDICLKYGFQANNKLQTVRGFTLLPSDYLCPKDFRTRQMRLTKNTLTIHHFDGSWNEDVSCRYTADMMERFGNIPGIYYPIRFLSKIKYGGFRNALNFIARKIKE